MIIATLKGPRNLVIEEIDSPKQPLGEEELLVKTKVTALETKVTTLETQLADVLTRLTVLENN